MLLGEGHIQFIRFGITGVLSNGILYLGYLGLTFSGIEPKIAMTLLFAVGIIQTFLINKKWTFKDGKNINGRFYRYLVVYGLMYGLNLLALVVFVDQLGLPHWIVQGVMVGICGVLLFFLQKFWVFSGT